MAMRDATIAAHFRAGRGEAGKDFRPLFCTVSTRF